jgi:hypothetical protein
MGQIGDSLDAPLKLPASDFVHQKREDNRRREPKKYVQKAYGHGIIQKALKIV